MWRGPPLAEFARERFAQPEIARLEELRLAAWRSGSRPTWRSAGSGAGRGARGARRGASAEGRAAGAADAGAVPIGPAGGGAGGLPGGAERRWWRSSASSRAGAARLAGDPPPGSGARAAPASRGARRGGLEAVSSGAKPSWRAPRRPRRRVRRARPFPAPGRAGDRQEPARGGADAPGRGAGRACSSGAAGRRAARRHTGPGRSRCAATCAGPRAGRRTGQTRPGWCADCAIVAELRALPECPRGAVRVRGARFRLFDATAQFLRARRPAARARPRRPPRRRRVVPPPAEVRRTGAGRGPLLVLGAAATSTRCPGPRLPPMLAEVGRGPGVRRLELGGLSEARAPGYVGDEAADFERSEVRRCTSETGGNPLFAGEIVRLLRRRAPRDACGRSPRASASRSRGRLSHLSDGAAGRCARLCSRARVHPGGARAGSATSG